MLINFDMILEKDEFFIVEGVGASFDLAIERSCVSHLIYIGFSATKKTNRKKALSLGVPSVSEEWSALLA